VRERPGPTALLEHILGAEAAHKLQQRIGRRIDRSGLKEHKTLEAFDFDFQPKLDKSVVLELARLDFVRTAAILDRLAMHALRIDIDGPSYRQHVAHERATGRGAKRTERERAPRHEADGD
jgi:DNA replication protein DnaC